jgi:hypothetical protein
LSSHGSICSCAFGSLEYHAQQSLQSPKRQGDGVTNAEKSLNKQKKTKDLLTSDWSEAAEKAKRWRMNENLDVRGPPDGPKVPDQFMQLAGVKAKQNTRCLKHSQVQRL